MTILGILTPLVSIVIAIIAQLLIGSRNQKAGSEAHGREMGSITTHLEAISSDVKEIKKEQTDMGKQLAATETTVKGLRHDLNELKEVTK